MAQDDIVAQDDIAHLFDLSERTAVVTGAAQGMGAAIARRLAQAGADVVLAGRNPDALKRTAAEIEDRGGRTRVVEADTANIADIDRIVAAATEFDQRVPLGGVSDPDDVANAVLFLAGRAADRITGSVLVVDGGLLLT